MSLSFQPNLIRRDSTIPIRLAAAGWLMGVTATIVDGPFGNRMMSLLAFTFLAGGLISAMLSAPRTIRMVFGAVAGTIAAWLGYRYAVDDRILPAIDESPGELLDRERFFAVMGGLGVLAIGVAGLLEALRSQSLPGNSPLPVKILLLVIGVFIAYTACTYADVSGSITLIVIVAVGAALAAMAWFRVERPPEEFQPTP